MPIQINEIVIRAIISGQGEGAEEGNRPQRDGEVDTKAIVAECVEQVLEILREKDER